MSNPEKHPAVPGVVKPPSIPSFEYENIDKKDKIGSGGEANVYEGVITIGDDSHKVAIKEPRFEGTIDTGMFEKFKREAETWSELDSHNNIVSVYGYGAGSIPWIALEYMDGGTLDNKINNLETAEALWMAGRIAEGIHYGHLHGIAHLDLKPTNILTRKTPKGKWEYPKVSDWGLAKLLLEHSKSVEGLSPTYAAPEQFDAETYGRPDDFTDIYQFGTIVYELLTGRPPFAGSPTDVMQSILQKNPPAPTEIDPNLPPKVDEVLLTALKKEKSGRYESMVLFRRELDRLFEEHTEEKFILSESGSISTDKTKPLSSESTPSASSEIIVQETGAGRSDTNSSILSRRAAIGLLGVGITGGGTFAATQSGLLENNQTGTGPEGTGPESGGSGQPVDDVELSEAWSATILNVFDSGGIFIGKNTSRGEEKIHHVSLNGEKQYFQSIDPSYELNLNQGKAYASNDSLIFAAGENSEENVGKIAAFELIDGIGRKQWTHTTDQVGTEPNINYLSADEERVYYAQEGWEAQQSVVRALAAGSKNIEWEQTVNEGYLSGITAYENTLVVGRSQRLDFFNASTGEKESEIELGMNSPRLTQLDDTLYAVGTAIKAYDLDSREEQWAVTGDRGAETKVAMDENRLYTGTEGGFLTAHSLSDGKKRWEVRPDHDIDTKPAATNGVVWICNSTGRVSGYGGMSGERFFNGSDLVDRGRQASIAALDSVLLVSLLYNDNEHDAEAFNINVTYD